MATRQIPNLPAAISLNGQEQLEAVQAGTSVRITTGQLTQLIPAGPTGPQGEAGPVGPAGPEGPAGNASNVDTVAAFEASSFAAIIQSVNILGYYSIGVGAFPVRRVSSEPSHTWKFRSTDRYLPNGSTDNTNGGWWEGYSVDDIVSPEMFGALGDGVTDDWQSITDMISYIESQIGTYGPIAKIAGQFSCTAYYCSQQIQSYKATTYFCAAANGMDGQTSAELHFPVGVAGWRIHHTPTGGGGSPKFVNIRLYNLYNGGPLTQTPALIHGWTIEKSVVMYGCAAQNFPGNNFHINGASDGFGFDGTIGFADMCRFDQCTSDSPGINGFYCYGQDANIILFIQCSSHYAPQWGFRSEGFLKNVFFTCHTSVCGGANFPVPPCVNYGGKVWGVVPKPLDFFLTDPATTTPGTDDTVWYPITRAPVPSNWVYGTNYQSGGGYCALDGSIFLNCYSEGGQSANYGGQVISPLIDANGQYVGVNSPFNPESFSMNVVPDPRSTDEALQIAMGTYYNYGGSKHPLAYKIETASLGAINEEAAGADGLRRFNSFTINYTTYWELGPNSKWTHGLPSNVSEIGGIISFPKIGLGSGNDADVTLGIVVSVAGGPPVSGHAGKGWIVINSNPSTNGSPFGWVCTTAGTNGSTSVWTPVYALPQTASLANAVDDSAAATAGVPVGGFYRNGSVLMVRVS